VIRVLSIGEFDPCEVILRHRDALRKFYGSEIDSRIALQFGHTDGQRRADWVHSVWKTENEGVYKVELTPTRGPMGKWDDLLEFAKSADVIQFLPGIGQPWGSGPKLPRADEDAPMCPFMDIATWESLALKARARVAYFHGSVNTWANRDHYVRKFEDYTLATSTLDYACELPAFYLPPVGPVCGEPAALRGDDDPLLVAHTPTHPDNCHTSPFLHACHTLGVVANYRGGWLEHDRVLDLKRGSNAGFDHLRGSFSVNSLENCTLGLANIVGLKHSYRQRLVGEGFATMPGPHIESVADMQGALRLLRDDPGFTRSLQTQCREWATRAFEERRIATRVLEFYRGLL